MKIYIVWIGGLIDYEGTDIDKANLIYQEWIDKGYDDVKIETIENA